MGRSAQPAAGALSQLIPGMGSPWLDPASLRRLCRLITILRWVGGFLIVATVGYILPPRTPAWLVVLIFWLAAYNSLVMLALPRSADASLPSLVRLVAALDLISFFGWVAIYAPSPPLVIWAVYPAILIIDIGLDGLLGAVYSIAAFLIGFTAFQVARGIFYGAPIRLVDLLVWVPIFLCMAAGLLVVDQALLRAPGPGQRQPLLGVVDGTPPALRLSPREQEVLRLVAEGYSNTMIASRLHLSENTVKGHVESLLTRLNARNRAEAVAAASRMNLI